MRLLMLSLSLLAGGPLATPAVRACVRVDRVLRLAILLVLFSTLGGCPPTPGVRCKAPMPAAFDASIRSVLEDHPTTPGVVVGVHRPDIGFAGRRVWERVRLFDRPV